MSRSTRRDFLKNAASGIVFTIGVSGLLSCERRQMPQTVSATALGRDLNIWIAIGVDDTVAIKYPATEMGQGSSTTLPAIVADELDADWEKVVVETVAVHDTAYGNPLFQDMLYTAGSLTVQGYFERLRAAGAQARRILMESAAAHWGVPLHALSTEPSSVVHGPSGRRLSYGEVASFMEVPSTPQALEAADLKDRAQHRYLGTDLPRRDVPLKSNGTARFGIDVRVPGMRYVSVLRAPVEGEEPVDIGDRAAREITGVTDIVPLPWGVAVVAESIEASRLGKAALDVTWTQRSPFRQANLTTDLRDYAALARDTERRGTAWREAGDARAQLEASTGIIEATYLSDPAYHAQMEPMNATVNVTEGGKAAEIWVSTQTQSLSILGAAEFLETSPDRITLHPMYIGGGYGRRTLRRQKYVEDALYVSRAIQRPVKVIWSREDDLKDGAFRNAAAQYLRAGFDDAGRLVAWHHRVAAPRVLEYMNPPRWEAAAGRDVIAMLGSESSRYDIPNFLAEHIFAQRRSRVCAWRGVATSYTKFAAESFIDELAAARGSDPLEFRLALCHNDRRAADVLHAVAGMADWSRARADTSLGLALAGYGASYAAGVAEISVERSSGRIQVHNFWLVADAGYLLAPRNAAAQLEGNVIFGLSNALRERLDIVGGEVQQSNFHDYPVARIGDVPNIEVRTLSTSHPPTGIGEIGLATTGAAVANALFAGTGIRIRHLPLLAERVRAALAA